jgi:hypothetical protein
MFDERGREGGGEGKRKETKSRELADQWPFFDIRDQELQSFKVRKWLSTP